VVTIIIEPEKYMIAKERETLFKQWLDEYKGLMLKVVRAYSPTRDDQEDLFQEILIQLWKSIPNFQGNAKVSTWIYKVALNTALVWKRDEKKRCRRSKPLIDIEQTPEINDQNESALKQQIIKQLYEAIRKLPKIDSSVILMYLDGLSYREMAEVLGISENNVGVKLNRTKKQLAKLMKGLIDDF